MGIVKEIFQEAIADGKGIYDVAIRSGQQEGEEPSASAQQEINKAFNPLQPRGRNGQWIDQGLLNDAVSDAKDGSSLRLMAHVFSSIDMSDQEAMAKAIEYFKERGVSPANVEEAAKAAASGRQPVSTEDYNELTNKLEEETGKNILDWYESNPELGKDRQADVEWMEKTIQENRDKPQDWEPDDFFDLKNFEVNPDADPEAEAERKKYWESRQKLKDGMLRDLKRSKLPPDKKRAYAETMYQAFQSMSPKALLMASQNVIETKFYSDQMTMTKKLYPDAPGKRIGGCWEFFDGYERGTLHLDGGSDPKGYYTHELGHSVDWDGSARQKISELSSWKAAYESEINTPDKPLSDYATTDPGEGFAEFARLAWSGKRPTDVAEAFPKCWEVFLKYELVRPIRKPTARQQAELEANKARALERAAQMREARQQEKV